MSAVDRIRDEIAHAEYGAYAGTTVELWTEEAEALCDLADAARAWRHGRPYCSCDRPPEHDRLREVVDRLDGEEQ